MGMACRVSQDPEILWPFWGSTTLSTHPIQLPCQSILGSTCRYSDHPGPILGWIYPPSLPPRKKRQKILEHNKDSMVNKMFVLVKLQKYGQDLDHACWNVLSSYEIEILKCFALCSIIVLLPCWANCCVEGLQTVFPFVSVPRDQYRVLVYTIDITQLFDISVSLDSSHVVVRHNHTSCPSLPFWCPKWSFSGLLAIKNWE